MQTRCRGDRFTRRRSFVNAAGQAAVVPFDRDVSPKEKYAALNQLTDAQLERLLRDYETLMSRVTAGLNNRRAAEAMPGESVFERNKRSAELNRPKQEAVNAIFVGDRPVTRNVYTVDGKEVEDPI